MADRRRRSHRELADAPSYPSQVWPVAVPYASSVERMTTERRPLTAIKRPGPALEAYRELWRRAADRLGLTGSTLVSP